MNEIQNDDTDNEYEERLSVSFTLTGKNLISDDITTRLEISPSFSFRRGDIKINGKGETHQHGCWSIDSKNKGLGSGDPIVHFERLLSILEPVQEKLEEILTDRSITARISCFWITPDGRINLEVEPKLLVQLANLNLRIWFDIYCSH